jgi:hypothetical protein
MTSRQFKLKEAGKIPASLLMSCLTPTFGQNKKGCFHGATVKEEIVDLCNTEEGAMP